MSTISKHPNYDEYHKDHLMCPLLWQHLCVNTDGSLAPCCELTKFDKPLNPKESLQVAYNTDKFKDIRRRMLAGETNKHCDRICYSQERTGNISKRLREIKHYEKKYGVAFSGYESEQGNIKEINYLDFKPSNYCNSKCVMCNNNRSSQYALESKKNKGYEGPVLVGGWYEENKHKIEPLYDNVWRFKINGGETTVMPEFETIISAVGDAPNTDTHLILNINNTVDITKYDEHLSKVKRINLVSSIEGWESVNEYIRFPGKWDNIYNNLKTFDAWAQTKGKLVECYFGMVIMSLNYQQFPLTVQKLEQEFPRWGFDIHIINQPKQLMVKGLTQEQLELGLERMESVYPTLTERTQRKMTHGLNYYRDAVKQGTDNNTRQMLKDYVQYIDSARNININNYIPELQINTG